MTRALALTSGGLDSILAAKLIQEQGIDVIALCFKSAFFGPANAIRVTKAAGIPLEVIDFTDEHLKMVKKPKNGYGKNMNPCIDCHAMMLRYAGKMLDEMQADFLVTGEVLNQRPMSQNRKALEIVQEESGFEDKILRPLCAQNLPVTPMERDGLVDRSKLLKISGKSRKEQMALAEKMGIKDYPTPAGGCLLTEILFSSRLRDLLKYNNEANAQDIELLKIGRHFRLSPETKAVSTRNQEEYALLNDLLKKDYVVFNTAEFNGSTVVIVPSDPAVVPLKDIETAAAITARYSKGKDQEEVLVKYKKSSEAEYGQIYAKPIMDEQAQKLLL